MLWPSDTVVEFEHDMNNTIKKLRRELKGRQGTEPSTSGSSSYLGR